MASQFDLALSKPLIEPATSDESFMATNGNGTSTSATASASASSTGQSATYSNKLSAMTPNNNNFNNAYNPPQLNDEEEQSLLLTQITSPTASHLGTQIDTALLTERHSESQHIHQQMRTINAINQDLACLVESQQETIDVIEQDAFEIHDRTERGVSHLMRAKKMMKDGMRGEGIMRVFFFVLAVGGTFIALILLLEAL